MTVTRTYLDWNATEPLRPEAREAMLGALGEYGNPSSVHTEGRRARSIIENAREQVAALVSADADDVYFTSGATEANNLVVRSGWATILLADVEHDSVQKAAEVSSARVVRLPTRADGSVAVEAIDDHVLKGDVCRRSLVALQLANNETGVLQPVAKAGEIAQAHGLSVLCDAVQAAGRIDVDLGRLKVDYMTLSAHKLGGPKGVGAIVVRSGAALDSLIVGGGQERRTRAGTENVPGIVGFGAAAQAARRQLRQTSERVALLRRQLETGIGAVTPEATIIAGDGARLPNTTCVALPGRKAEILVAGLDLAGIAVSAGAACSSGKVARSRVLDAMGVGPEVADGAIRVSLGRTTTETDIAAFLAAWRSLADSRRRAA